MMITIFDAFRIKIKIDITRRANNSCWILLVVVVICIIHSYYDHLQSNAFNCRPQQQQQQQQQQHRIIVVQHRESVLRISNYNKVYHNDDHHMRYQRQQQPSFRINKRHGSIIVFQQLTDTYDNNNNNNNNNDNVVVPNNNEQQQQSIVLLDTKDPKSIRNIKENTSQQQQQQILMIKDKSKMIEYFIQNVIQLIQNETFVSMTLYGPNKNNKNKRDVNESNELRGCIRLVTARLIKLSNPKKKRSPINNINDDGIIKLQVTFKYHSATDIVKNWDIPNKKDRLLMNDEFEMIMNNNIDIITGLHYLLTTNITTTMESSYYSDAIIKRLIPLSEWDKQQQQQPNNNMNDDGIIMNQIITESAGGTKKLGIQKAILEHSNGNMLELDIGLMNRIKWKIKTNTINRDKTNNNNELSQNDRGENNNDVLSDGNNNVILNHDRMKQFIVPITEPFWSEIGILNKINGKVIVGMSSKLKQCQKFVEIVNRLLLQSTSSSNIIEDNQQQQQQNGNNNDPLSSEDDTIIQLAQNQINNKNSKKRILSVVDMGCGRGYITFALHSFLQKHYSSAQQQIRSIGYDIRPKLMNEMNYIIQNKLDYQFNKSLSFEVGTIESFVKEQQRKQQQEIEPYVPELIHNNVYNSTTSKESSSYTKKDNDVEEMKILIALHACDTATDDAIWCGIVQRAQIIVVAPCCHKQCRIQLNDHMNNNKHSINHPYYDILRHNVYRERVSETVTDTIRSLLLELAGYTVQVFEFIGGEHTSKNVMITGVRYNTTKHLQQKDGQNTKLINRIRSIAALHGIRYHKLAQSMNISLTQHDDDSYNSNDFMSLPEQNSNLRLTSKTRRSIQSMPPLAIKDNFY